VIAVPCPAAYMNETCNSNGWSDATDLFTEGIDPDGPGLPGAILAERAAEAAKDERAA